MELNRNDNGMKKNGKFNEIINKKNNEIKKIGEQNY